MRYFTSLPILIFLCLGFTGYSQSRPQVRLKIGAVKSIVSPGDSKGYAYKINSSDKLSVDIGLEFSQPLRNSSSSCFAGISLDPHNKRFSLNRSNFQTFDNDPAINVEETTFRFYGGLGKKISNSGQNLFTLFGGFGLAVNFGSHLTGLGSPSGTEGIMKNGERFKSPFNNFPLHPGFQTWVYTRREFKITPTLFTGLRWQCINRKGNDGLGLELLGNYGLVKYFEYKVPYTLDGVDHEDRFDEKGICAQLNLIIPLWNFGRNKPVNP